METFKDKMDDKSYQLILDYFWHTRCEPIYALAYY